MKSLEVWNPFRELDEVQNRLSTFFGGFPEFGRFPKRLFGNGDVALPDWSPLVDISEDDKEYLVKADLPEMKKEDVKVTVENGVLSISGERKSEKEEKRKKFSSDRAILRDIFAYFHTPRQRRLDQDSGRVQRGRAQGASPEDPGGQAPARRGKATIAPEAKRDRRA
jgi:HSP20 family protein